jgi:hypothetical protein
MTDDKKFEPFPRDLVPGEILVDNHKQLWLAITPTHVIAHGPDCDVPLHKQKVTVHAYRAPKEMTVVSPSAPYTMLFAVGQLEAVRRALGAQDSETALQAAKRVQDEVLASFKKIAEGEDIEPVEQEIPHLCVGGPRDGSVVGLQLGALAVNLSDCPGVTYRARQVWYSDSAVFGVWHLLVPDSCNPSPEEQKAAIRAAVSSRKLQRDAKYRVEQVPDA